MKFIRNNPTLKERRQELRRNQTDAEKNLWYQLRNKRFHGTKFFRQYSVGAYILDFYSPELSLAIELDGGQHAEKEKQEYDEARSDYLKGHGIKVIRFWNNEVLQNIEGVLHRIEEEIAPSSNPLGPP